MDSTSQNQKQQKAVKKLMRGLLAGTCLTVAAAAQASTISEPPDFSNSLAGAVASPLPVGTNIVNGSAIGSDNDFFDFVGLLGGGMFTLQFNALAGGLLDFAAYNSFGVQFGATASDVGSTTITGTIPVNGQLVGFVGHDEGTTYTVTLTAPLGTATPEPATAGLAGLGLTAAGLLAARRRKQSR